MAQESLHKRPEARPQEPASNGLRSSARPVVPGAPPGDGVRSSLSERVEQASRFGHRPADYLGRRGEPEAGTLPASSQAPIQRYFRSNDFLAVNRKDKQGLFTTQAEEPTAKVTSEGIKMDREMLSVPPEAANLLVADDFTMAIHDTEREPKEFYATNRVIANSNTELEKVESSFRLDNQTGNSIKVGPNTLKMVKPVNQKAKQNGGGSATQDEGFVALLRHICIEMTSELVGLGGGSSYEMMLNDPESGERYAEEISPRGQSDEKVDRLAAFVAQNPEDQSPETVREALRSTKPRKGRYAKDYGTKLRKGQTARSTRSLGINKHALPDVGEGFATFSQRDPKDPDRDYSARGGRKDQLRQNTWGYHFAGVVAKSIEGNDRVTLENYRRDPQYQDAVNPAMRAKFGKDLKEIKKKDPKATLEEQVNSLIADNQDAYDTYTKAMASGGLPSKLWFFRMYGVEQGQTFHEKQAAGGGYVNPITVHVRRSLAAQKRGKAGTLQKTLKGFSDSLQAAAIPDTGAKKIITGLTKRVEEEGGKYAELLEGAADNDAFLRAVLSIKKDFSQLVETEVIPALQKAYRGIEGDASGQSEGGSKELLKKVEASLKPKWGEFFSQLLGKTSTRLESLGGLRDLLGKVPKNPFEDFSLTKVSPKAGPSQQKTDTADWRLNGKEKDDDALEQANIARLLATRRLKIEETVTNGDCMYDAVRRQLAQVEGVEISINQLRQKMAALITANQGYFAGFILGGNAESLAQRISRARSWNDQSGDIAAQVIATVLQREVTVISPTGIDRRRPVAELQTSEASTVKSDGQPLTIVYNGRDHYYSTAPA